MVILELTLPLRVVNWANAREHWRARARRVASERRLTRCYCLALLEHRHDPRPLTVTLTRIAPRSFDSDGLAISFKAVRDEVAALLGRDDGPTSGITWVYAQDRGAPKTYAARVVVEVDDDGR